MTQHSELYQRIIKTRTDTDDRREAFRDAGPTPAAFRKMSKVRQEAQREVERQHHAQSAAQELGELMQIACELYKPMEMVALMTRIAKPYQDTHTSSGRMADLLLGELIEKALEIEARRVGSLLRAV